MTMQLSLNVGGATIDTAKLGSIKFAKAVNEIDTDFNKGDDIIISVRCRILGAHPKDRYDAHGNIVETTKTFDLRADDLLECKLDTKAAWQAHVEKEDDAVSQEQLAKAKEGTGSQASNDTADAKVPPAPLPGDDGYDPDTPEEKARRGDRALSSVV
jgi:hypothetical protein